MRIAADYKSVCYRCDIAVVLVAVGADRRNRAFEAPDLFPDRVGQSFRDGNGGRERWRETRPGANSARSGPRGRRAAGRRGRGSVMAVAHAHGQARILRVTAIERRAVTAVVAAVRARGDDAQVPATAAHPHPVFRVSSARLHPSTASLAPGARSRSAPDAGTPPGSRRIPRPVVRAG